MTASAGGVAPLAKAPTGIAGFDEVTRGGLPRGRPTLVAGSAGAGKTLFGIEFLVRGALDHGEPGVLIAFEELASDIATNVASLGYDLPAMEAAGQLVIDAFELDPADFMEAGQYDLEGLFLRLQLAVDSIGAKRVVLDTLEVLFAALPDVTVVRSELTRLFRWLKERGLTVVITGERGGGAEQLTRIGIEEFVSDCVVVLDHRVTDGTSTRRLRITKYRGSLHGTDEYPFLITDRGITVVPLSGLGLEYDASEERVSTGVPALDEMLGGGFFRGSSCLISGSAGTGKTSIGAGVAVATCEAGERALLFSFEESPRQLVRNMRSIGLDLQRWIDSGQLRIHSVRATAFGLEEHLSQLHRLVEEHEPSLVVLDAVISLQHTSQDDADLTSTLTRDLDLLKGRGITGVLTVLGHGDTGGEMGMSSLVDSWLLLRNQESNGERNRLMFVIKSRGTAHSNQVREFVLGSDGPKLVDVLVGPDGVLTGSAREEHLARLRTAETEAEHESARRRRASERRTAALQAQIAALEAQLHAEHDELEQLESSEADAEDARADGRVALASRRTPGAVR